MMERTIKTIHEKEAKDYEVTYRGQRVFFSKINVVFEGDNPVKKTTPMKKRTEVKE